MDPRHQQSINDFWPRPVPVLIRVQLLLLWVSSHLPKKEEEEILAWDRIFFLAKKVFVLPDVYFSQAEKNVVIRVRVLLRQTSIGRTGKKIGSSVSSTFFKGLQNWKACLSSHLSLKWISYVDQSFWLAPELWARNKALSQNDHCFNALTPRSLFCPMLALSLFLKSSKYNKQSKSKSLINLILGL